MNTHTPGPWACEFHETAAGTPFGIVVGGKGKGGLMDTVICHAPDYRDEPVSYKVFKSANARLIAAAPENYASNKELAATVRELCGAYGHPLPEASLARSDAAIAKAEKEQA